MRRTTTLALLTATLMVGGSSAALAQAGPPSDVPQPPAQAQGSAQTGEENSAQGRAASDNAQAQGSAETGQESSANGRATASEKAGFDVPAHDEAQGGREFGQERADEAKDRGDDATENDDNDTTGDLEEPVDTDDANLDEITDPDATDVELPDEAPDEARGMLANITATFESVLTTLQSLLGMVTATA